MRESKSESERVRARARERGLGGRSHTVFRDLASGAMHHQSTCFFG